MRKDHRVLVGQELTKIAATEADGIPDAPRSPWTCRLGWRDRRPRGRLPRNDLLKSDDRDLEDWDRKESFDRLGLTMIPLGAALTSIGGTLS